MKNLFIDSNIWLSLYHFTNDDLAQFSKLKDMVNKSIRLFVPQQVYDEITRNREVKLKDALKSFDIKTFRFPAFCKGYSEFETVRIAYNSFMNQVNAWKKTIDNKQEILWLWGYSFRYYRRKCRRHRKVLCVYWARNLLGRW